MRGRNAVVRENLRHSFERQVFRTKVYEYDGVDQLGHLTIVTEAHDGHVEYLSHDLYRVQPGQMNYDDFCKRFTLDIYLTGTEALTLFKEKLLTRLVVVPPTAELIEELLKVKPPKEDKVLTFRDKIGTADTKYTVCVDELNQVTLARAVFPTTDKNVKITHIPMGERTIEMIETPETEFLKRYRPFKKYPPDKLAAILVEYAVHLGGSVEALAELGKIVNVKAQETEMATKKKAETEAAPAPEKTKVGKAEKVAKAPAEKKERAPSASSRFQELIMEAKLTDDQIFEKVSGEFGLDESKRSYVTWYRNKLKKDGKNPPAPVGGEKVKAEKPAKAAK